MTPPAVPRFFTAYESAGVGRVVVRQAHRNAGAGEDFGDDLRRALRDEARVVADNQAFAGVFVLVNVVRHRIADAAYVVEGEVVGDDAAPTVGAKLDLCGHWSVLSCHHEEAFRPTRDLLFLRGHQFYSQAASPPHLTNRCALGRTTPYARRAQPHKRPQHPRSIAEAPHMQDDPCADRHAS